MVLAGKPFAAFNLHLTIGFTLTAPEGPLLFRVTRLSVLVSENSRPAWH